MRLTIINDTHLTDRNFRQGRSEHHLEPSPDLAGLVGPALAGRRIPVVSSIDSEMIMIRLGIARDAIIEQDLKSPAFTKFIQNYDELIDRVKTLQTPVGLSDDSANKILQSLSNGVVTRGFRNMLSQVSDTTEYLADFNDMGVGDYLKAGLDEHLLPVAVRWHKLSGTSSRGRYTPSAGNSKIEIKDRKPKLKEIWSSLASSGCLPPPVATLRHELIHHAHYSTPKFQEYLKQMTLDANRKILYTVGWLALGALTAIMSGQAWIILVAPAAIGGLNLRGRSERDSRFAASQQLTEIQAYDATHCPPFSFLNDELEGVFLGEGPIGSLASNNLKPTDKLREEIQAIQFLRCLGFSRSEVAQFVSQEMLATVNGSTGQLAAEVARLRRENGLQTESAYHNFVYLGNNLAILDGYLNRIKATQIAVEHLLALAPPDNNPFR